VACSNNPNSGHDSRTIQTRSPRIVLIDLPTSRKVLANYWFQGKLSCYLPAVFVGRRRHSMAGVTVLLMIVMRALLRQATALRRDMEAI
jgi:hypothetical protein